MRFHVAGTPVLGTADVILGAASFQLCSAHLEDNINPVKLRWMSAEQTPEGGVGGRAPTLHSGVEVRKGGQRLQPFPRSRRVAGLSPWALVSDQ